MRKGDRRKYYIQFQWRRAPEPGENLQNWRSWRQFAVWPCLFNSQAEAWDYFHSVGNPFRNLTGKRKVSASVQSTIVRAKEVAL